MMMTAPRSVMGEETLTGDADSDDKSATLTLGAADAPEGGSAGALSDGVVITLTLMTGKAVSLPLMVGEITASVTLIDTELGTDTFDDAFTSPLTIFEIRPAQCDAAVSGRDRLTPDFGMNALDYGTLRQQSGDIWTKPKWQPAGC